MPVTHLKTSDVPKMTNATMLLALTGWMDGGLVSTGTVQRMMEGRDVREIARIESDPFYIYNMPGSMEVAAMFRPDVRYEDGVIGEMELPRNVFFCDEAANLLFFTGKEPNLLWQDFADCIFDLATHAGVGRILFMGSFGGTVPHTREPRMYGSVSHPHLKDLLKQHGMKLSDYQGPAGFSSLLLAQSADRGIEMLSIVAEIPGYLEGLNPLSIEAVTRRLAKILNIPVNLDKLRELSNEWEIEVSNAVEKDEKLAATVRKLEEDYDNKLINPEDE